MRAAVGLAVLLLAAAPASTQGLVDDPVADYVRQHPPVDADWNELQRIRRDFNNDGIEDMAVGESALHGQAVGAWQLYLGAGGGRYRHLAPLDLSAQAYRIIGVRPGTARIIGCGRAGDRIRAWALLVDGAGVRESGEALPEFPLEGSTSPEWDHYCGGYVAGTQYEGCRFHDWRAGPCRWAPRPPR
jgi:hypothetical protein